MLVVARAGQGLAGAIVSPAALALLTTTFPEGRDRNRALGVFGAVASAGGARTLSLGPVGHRLQRREGSRGGRLS
jgi:MFS family permease